ncbi:MAG: aminopeptidase [Sporomusaceae bacterium]|nr:aminopeptidase [Sporomusaceae bacterium]
MNKLQANLCASIEKSDFPVRLVAVYYQKNQQLAEKIADLLPYPTIVVDGVRQGFTEKMRHDVSHAIELSHPAEPDYELCKWQRARLLSADCLVLNLYDWQESYLADSFWGITDYRELAGFLENIKHDLEKVSTFHITSDIGTDISFSVKKRRWIMANGLFRQDELSQMPDGEIYTCPIEDTFEGVLMVDGTITRSWVPKEPQRLEFAAGKLVKASPDFAKYIRPLGPDIYLIGEFALGFNPAHKAIVHNISVDEKAAGTIHFALGDSYQIGKNHCSCHVDMVIREPKIITDPLISLPFFTKK